MTLWKSHPQRCRKPRPHEKAPRCELARAPRPASQREQRKRSSEKDPAGPLRSRQAHANRSGKGPATTRRGAGPSARLTASVLCCRRFLHEGSEMEKAAIISTLESWLAQLKGAPTGPAPSAAAASTTTSAPADPPAPLFAPGSRYQRLRKTRAFQRWCEENPGPDRPLSAEELEILERLRQAGEEL